MRFTLALLLFGATVWFASARAQQIDQSNQNILPTATSSTLPACGLSTRGTQFLITDALLPVFLGNLTGGGAISISVLCNGTNWIIG